MQAYTDRLSQYLEDVGYNGAAEFPWDIDNQVEQIQNNDYTGNFVYQGSLFQSDLDPQEAQMQFRTAYTAGYRARVHEPDPSYSEEQIEAFWIGYAQGGRDEVTVGGRRPNPEIPQREEALGSFATAADTQRGANPNSFSKLSGGLMADLYGVTVEILVEQITELLDFSELLELVKDIPVIGVLISVFVDSASCVVNVNRGDAESSLLELSQNIQAAIADFDICDLPISRRPITLPNIEELTVTFNVVSLRSLFVNSLLPMLRDLLIEILLNLAKHKK